MSERYNANQVVVTDDAVQVAGRVTAMDGILRAEAYQVEDWIRNALIFVIACFGPIVAMIVATQSLLVSQPLDDGHNYWFGPIVLVCAVACGIAGAAIGHFWPKPWGVVVERPEYGFGKLVRTASRDEAERIATAINTVKFG